MADEADQAQELQEHALNMALADAKKAHPALEQTGRCHNCGEETDFWLFCDSDCRDDYEHEQAARRRNGRHI